MSFDQPMHVLNETAECPHCGLHQYVKGGLCPKCHGSLGVEFVRLELPELHRRSEKSFRILPKNLGIAIRALRSERGISQEQLARAAGGMQRSHLSRIECGHVHPPLSTLLRVTGALGLNAIILRFGNTKLSSTSRTAPRSCRRIQNNRRGEVSIC